MKRSCNMWSKAIAVLAACSLTACGGSGLGDKTTSNGAAQKKQITSDEEATVTILMYGDNTPNARNPVLDELEKRTNTKIEMVYVSNKDYQTKLSTMIAAGTPPDIFECGIADAEDYKKNGLLADIGDLLIQSAPNIMKETEGMLDKVPVNEDGTYMVISPAKAYAPNINLRSDWLKNLNMEMPEDLDSFYDTMYAMTYADPDQNGQQDTYGYVFNLVNVTKDTGCAFRNIFGAYGIPAGKKVELEDGTVTTWVKHPQFLEAVTYIRKLIADGVTESDYVTIPQMDMFGKLWTGTAGTLEWECVGPTNNWMPVRYTQTPPPTFDFPVIKGPEGKHGVPAVYPNYSKGYVFSSSAKNLEGAVRIANYCMSPEGSDLLYLGVEGTMYQWIDKEKGTYEFLGEYKDSATHRAAGGYCYWTLFKPADNTELRTLNEQTRAGVELAWSEGIDWPYTPKNTQVEIDSGADMDQVINEMLADLLSTKQDLKTVYEEYLLEWENVGGSDWEKEATQLWAEQNQ